MAVIDLKYPAFRSCFVPAVDYADLYPIAVKGFSSLPGADEDRGLVPTIHEAVAVRSQPQRSLDNLRLFRDIKAPFTPSFYSAVVKELV